MSSWMNNKFNNLFPAFNEDKRFRYVNDAGSNMMTNGLLLGEFISVNENCDHLQSTNHHTCRYPILTRLKMALSFVFRT